MTQRSDRDSARNFEPPCVSSSALRAAAAAAAGCAATFAPAADAYVGPGAGMGLLGIMLALVAAILMALVGIVLWPIRMAAHRRRSRLREKDRDAQNGAHERDGRREPAAR